MGRINDFLWRIDMEEMREYCMANGEAVRYSKGECFVEGGCVGRYAGIVKSGYFKYCTLTTKDEYAVTGFSFADECVMDFTQSFLFDKPSKISIIAGCEAEVMRVESRHLRDYVSQKNPNLIPDICVVIMEEAYGRYLDLYRKSPSERYLELKEQYPDVLKCITLRDIASFLRVTPTYLSRMRKKLGK